jgi:hypothetical protein
VASDAPARLAAGQVPAKFRARAADTCGTAAAATVKVRLCRVNADGTSTYLPVPAGIGAADRSDGTTVLKVGVYPSAGLRLEWKVRGADACGNRTTAVYTVRFR